MRPIFISYRRDDAGGHAGRIFDRLRGGFGDQYVFFDQDDIEPGDHFPDRIEAAIRPAPVVLVVIGPDWLASLNERATSERIDFVQREVSIAGERKRNQNDRVEIIPLLVGGAAMPERAHLHGELRESIAPLFDYEALTFQGSQQDQDNQFERLFDCIAEVAGFVPEASVDRASELPVLSIVAPAPGVPVPGSVPAYMPDIDKVERAFRAVSRMLLDWPQETDGHWIERPELSRLRELTTGNSPSVTILLGGPGEGKSAILARLGSLLAEDDTVLLAIKADLRAGAKTNADFGVIKSGDRWSSCAGVGSGEVAGRWRQTRRRLS